MALFKILRGGKEGLAGTQKTDGWAYFTPENKGFFIDVTSQINGVDYDARIKINERAQTIKTVMGNWDMDMKECFIATGLSSLTGYESLIQLDEDSLATKTAAEKFAIEAALSLANISYSASSAGTIHCISNGKVPLIDIPVVITLIPSEF